MNSVFSAFKTNKNDKHSTVVSSRSIGGNSNNSSSSINNSSNSSNNSSSSNISGNCSNNSNNSTTKKSIINNGQENSYENLRHIREIGTSTKMMTSIIVNDDVEDDLLLHNRTILKTVNLNENDDYIQPLPKSSTSLAAQQLLLQQKTNKNLNNDNNDDDDDEVDHIYELDSTNIEMKLQEMKNEISMKRNLLNGGSGNGNNSNNGCCISIKNSKIKNNFTNQNNCDILKSMPSSSSNKTTSSSSSTTAKIVDDDYDKNTSNKQQLSLINNSMNSIDEHINSHHLSPTKNNSPAKSLSNTSIDSSGSNNSSSSSSTSCNDVTTIVSSLSTINTSDSNNYNNSNYSNGIIGGNIFNVPVIGNICTSKPPNSTIPIIMGNKNRNNHHHNNHHQQQNSLSSSSSGINSSTSSTNSATTTPKSTRYNKPRLSLSNFNNTNNSMPSVHGRSSMITNGGTNNGGQPKRLSNHQRNLSLDFRSMGILLPPVSQVTNTRINLTQHHRNRSLDSALQRIPEVEVSSPNAETTESTFCTNSILGSTMCSKIVSSSTEATTALSTNLNTESSTELSSLSTTTTNTQNTPIIASSATENIKEDLIEPCTRQKPIETSYHSTTEQHQSVPIIKNTGENKKREDLTSLGSDDSGIICGSESDQVSLNRIRHSHESLDSGEMDPEEECIEILETTSMDEEYRMLQSDLCFYQTPEKDIRTLKSCRKPEVAQAENTDDDIEDINKQNQLLNYNKIKSNNTNRIFPINIENDNNDDCGADDEDDDTQNTKSNSSDSTQIIVTTPQDDKSKSIIEPSATTSTASATKSNEVLFKNFNFFGATKNVIFRTAQSIIENHEKKIAAKNHKTTNNNDLNNSGSIINDSDIKSPTEITKKKEFFVLKSSSNKNKIAAASASTTIIPLQSSSQSQPTTPEGLTIATTTQAPVPPPFPNITNPTVVITSTSTTIPVLQSSLSVQPIISPEIEIKSITKSNSISSLHKIRVPGVVKCFIREKDPVPVPVTVTTQLQQQQQPTTLNSSTKTEKGPSGLLRFFESPIFNIHFAIHYLFYSKEPGVLSFIGNKIFNFPNQEVDLYIPQLIVMYIQMDELAEVLDPYLTIRCRKSVDFSLKCLWLLEAYNYQVDNCSSFTNNKKTNLSLMKELYSKKERKHILKTNQIQQVISPLATTSTSSSSSTTTTGQYQQQQHQQQNSQEIINDILSPIKKTHHRSQSDATGLLNDSRHYPNGIITNVTQFNFTNITNPIKTKLMYTPSINGLTKLCLGDLTSGRAFDNGCICFESVRGTVNDLLGQKTVCCCGAPKTSPQKEFMKALINVGKNLTQYQTKAEKTSALRILLNLINKNLPARVWLPLHSDDKPHHIVRITEEKTAVLNSKDKTPYIIYIEVVEVNDIYSSPVILKMMPTLRHTKSEEHLESNCPHHHNHNQQHHLNIIKKDSNSLCNRNTTTTTANTSSNGVGSGDNNNYCTGSTTINKIIITKNSESSNNSDHGNNIKDINDIQNFTEDDVWSQEDDEITAQYLNLHKISERDTISQMSLDSCDSRDQGIPTLFNIGDVRTRHCNNLNCENTKPFSNDPEDPSAAALKEPWHEKERQIRESSPYGHLSNWKLLSAIVKCGDDLRQELMATQLLQMFKLIWQEENVDLWVRPYKIVCLSDDSGLIEPILNTVSLHQIKKNSNKSLKDYFIDEYGEQDGQKFQQAQKNFVQSCAAYCLISYLLQVKDRHNGNILLHSDGHLIHIDFGFILSISPKNLGFEQSPFKLTAEFVEVMGGTSSELWTEFNHLLLKGLMAARKHMDRIINLVEIMRSNAQLPCFKNGCSGTVQNLRKRFHMNLTEQELERKVEQLVQDSLKSLSTKLYDGYQYFTNGIL